MCLAIPGKIDRIDGTDALTRMASVRFLGVSRPISLAMVPEATVGDFVLAHAGIAIAVIDEQQANDTLRELDAMDQAVQAGGDQ